MQKLTLVVAFSLLSNLLFSQIFISSDPADTVREKSAAFEVKSRSGGFLPPRMSTAERKAIVNPAAGLIVFDTSKQLFYGYVKALGWRPFSMGIDTAYISDAASPSNLIDNQTGDGLGVSVGIRNSLAVAGAFHDNINGKPEQGSLYVFKNVGGTWNNIQKITAPDGAAYDNFGNDVAMTDSFVIVSALMADVGENLDQGAVYVYKIQSDTLIYHQKLTSNLATSSDRFGTTVRVADSTLFIGVPYDDVSANTDQGTVYYFALENGYWIEKQKIIQDSVAHTWDYFGYGFSIKGNWVAIGNDVNSGSDYGLSQNAVFLYEKVNGVWQRRQKINQPDDLTGRRDGFGYSTFLTDSTLTIGAWLKDEPTGNKDRGAMYLFKKNGNTWTFVKKIAPTDPNPSDNYGDYFGGWMRGDDKILLVSASHEDLASGNIDKGAFFVYEWVSNEWQLKRKVSSPTPGNFDVFGRTTAIDNGNIITGAYLSNNGKGAVYFFSLMD